MRLLSSRDLSNRFSMADIIAMVEAAYREEGGGRVISSPRDQLRSDRSHTFFNVLPALMPGLGVVGLNAYTGGNKGLGLVQKVVLLFSAQDGRLLAVLEADWLSWMRTGASSGVATKYLASPDAHCAGIFGAGKQARSQLMAVAAVRSLERALVYSPRPERREGYTLEMSRQLGLEVQPVDTPAAILESAGIICTATTAREPLFDGRQVRPGTHLNAIGQHYPDRREVDSVTVARSRVVVDDRARAWQEDGELLIPLQQGEITTEHVYASLGEVVAGLKPGRMAAEITLFTSGGIASEILAVAAGVYEVAAKEGLGVEIEW
ncbi:MAG: ornithine cyclodeaminase family protein [Anaerolineae bacterium]